MGENIKTSNNLSKRSLEYIQNFNIAEFTAPLETHFSLWLTELANELKEQASKMQNILKGLLRVDRIFTVGTGRSELMIRNTGMRLMHEGFSVHRISESYTPAIGNDPEYKDALLFYSGSGKTRLVISVEGIAREKGVPIFGVSGNKYSEAVNIAGEENVIITKGKKIYLAGAVPREENQPINFLQTVSEFKAYVIGELIVSAIANAKGLTEKDLENRHANTE
jgi:D-arabinose 5-phosphate isomerase GutQ